MEILQNFEEIISYTFSPTGLSASVKLNPKHEVFQGHFPENPVTPGVCMIHLVKKLTEKKTDKTLILSSAKNVKFMAVVNPEVDPLLSFQLDIVETASEIEVVCVAQNKSQLVLKAKFVYKHLS